MDLPFGPPTLVVDPRARAELPRVREALRAQGVDFSEASDDRPVAALEESLRAGHRYFLVVGDDSTFNLVVNALMEAGFGDGVVLGIVPVGAPNDVIKTFGLPEDLERTCIHAKGPNYYELDVARISTSDGAAGRAGYFANIAEAGFGAEVVRRTSRSRFDRAGRFVSFWMGLAVSRTTSVTVEVDRKRYEGPAYDIVVGNCQFFGGGLRVSPRSYPGDGILDVLVMKGPRSDAFTTLPKMYRGEHVPSEHIAELRGRHIRIEADRTLPVHADGQVFGTTPVEVQVIPQAVRLKV